MSAVSYKCPNCGGELTFDPQTQKYKCEYCFSYFTEDQEELMSWTEFSKKLIEKYGKKQLPPEQPEIRKLPVRTAGRLPEQQMTRARPSSTPVLAAARRS